MAYGLTNPVNSITVDSADKRIFFNGFFYGYYNDATYSAFTAAVAEWDYSSTPAWSSSGSGTQGVPSAIAWDPGRSLLYDGGQT